MENNLKDTSFRIQVDCFWIVWDVITAKMFVRGNKNGKALKNAANRKTPYNNQRHWCNIALDNVTPQTIFGRYQIDM